MTKIQELGGIKLLPNPTYSPELAPSDYHLFRSMAHSLHGRNFENIKAVEVGPTKFFASKTRDWYHCGLINLAEKILKTIKSDDLYRAMIFTNIFIVPGFWCVLVSSVQLQACS